MNLNEKLHSLDEQGKPIKIGLVGAGQMGKGMVSQISRMKGIYTAAIADINGERAVDAYVASGIPSSEIIKASNLIQIDDAIKSGKPVVTEDASLIANAELVDVVIDATGIPEAGAALALQSITNKKHIVMLSVETDITIGPILKKLADSAGIVYTGSAGDEPGAIKELYDFANALGFEIIVAGKGKNNPLDREATPETLLEQAKKNNMNPKMLTCFVDGTKTMVEMTAVANAVDFIPDCRGMHGPKAEVDELPKIFSLKEQGGILNRKGVVDFANGVAPGVFVVVTTDLETIHEELRYLKMGDGPNYVFYRPYHLCSIETPLSAVRAYIYNEPTIVPLGKPKAETVAVAKRDLRAGEYLDGIGGFTIYGIIEEYEVAKTSGFLPIGLVNDKTRVKTDIKKGEIITYNMVEIDNESPVVQLRKLQEKIVG